MITFHQNPESSMDGPDACPQLQAQNGEVLVSNAVNKQIIVETSNLPDDNQVCKNTKKTCIVIFSVSCTDKRSEPYCENVNHIVLS